jgi:HTH-type transcriptional regulator / antitoxin HipB
MKRRFLTTPEAVAAAVRETRTELGLSQAQLARKARVGRRFIVGIEAGHPRAELGKVLDVLEALDIHATALPAPPVTKTLHDIDLDVVIRQHG